MNEYPKIFEQKINIKSYLVGEDMALTYSSLFELIQEISSNHSDICNIGWRKLKDSNLYWMISKMLVKINNMPKWSEDVILRTWIPTWNKLRTNLMLPRNYKMLDKYGNTLLIATASWIMYDANTNRLRNLSDFDENLVYAEDEDVIETAPKIQKIESEENYQDYRCIMQSDIDMNHHVNNANYIKWALDTIPQACRNNFSKLKNVAVNYLSQAKLGELYGVISKKITENKYITSIFSKDGKNEYCRIQSTWDNDDASQQVSDDEKCSI